LSAARQQGLRPADLRVGVGFAVEAEELDGDWGSSLLFGALTAAKKS